MKFREILGGGASWPKWEKIVWRIAVFFSALWISLGMVYLYFYEDIFISEHCQLVDVDRVDENSLMGGLLLFAVKAQAPNCSKDDIYVCAAINPNNSFDVTCGSNPSAYITEKSKQTGDTKFDIFKLTFGGVVTLFLAIGGLFGIVDRIKRHNS